MADATISLQMMAQARQMDRVVAQQQRQLLQMENTIRQMSRTSNEMEKRSVINWTNIQRQVLSAVGAYTAVSRAIQEIMEEHRAYLELVDSSQSAVRDYGAANQRMYAQLAGATDEQLERFKNFARTIAETEMIPYERVIDEQRQTFSALAGDFESRFAQLRPVFEEVAQMFSLNPEAISDFAGRVFDIQRITRTTPAQTIGFLGMAAEQARVTDISDVANLVPAGVAFAGRLPGDDRRNFRVGMSAAAAIGYLAAQTGGRVEATAAANLVKTLTENQELLRFAHESTTTQQRVAAMLESNDRQRQQLFEATIVDTGQQFADRLEQIGMGRIADDLAGASREDQERAFKYLQATVGAEQLTEIVGQNATLTESFQRFEDWSRQQTDTNNRILQEAYQQSDLLQERAGAGATPERIYDAIVGASREDRAMIFDQLQDSDLVRRMADNDRYLEIIGSAADGMQVMAALNDPDIPQRILDALEEGVEGKAITKAIQQELFRGEENRLAQVFQEVYPQMRYEAETGRRVAERAGGATDEVIRQAREMQGAEARQRQHMVEVFGARGTVRKLYEEEVIPRIRESGFGIVPQYRVGDWLRRPFMREDARAIALTRDFLSRLEAPLLNENVRTGRWRLPDEAERREAVNDMRDTLKRMEEIQQGTRTDLRGASNSQPNAAAQAAGVHTESK